MGVECLRVGTINAEATRGFSPYRWIKQQLIARGVPASQIEFMQDYKRSADKPRLFADFCAGRVRVLIGSSETMGTGVNAQQRLKTMHHLDVPWLPSQIEQREGRIERQAAIILDAAVTAGLVLSQRSIFSLGNDMRTRINALYMATVFSAGAAGSALASLVYTSCGWTGTALIDALLPLSSLVYARQADNRTTRHRRLRQL
jgi:hypothetical protein